MTTHALILRADASASIGLGHLARMCALADAVHAAGGATELVVAGDPLAATAFAAALGHAAIPAPLEAPTDAGELVDRARRTGGTIVLDGRDAVARLADRLAARAGVRLAIVDDLGGAPPADAIVNHNHRADALAPTYRARSLLLGRQFALLRRAVLRLPRGACVPQDRPRPRVAITLGGSDPVGATARLLVALPAAPALDVVVVTGPTYTATAELLAGMSRAAGRGHHVERVHAPADLPALLVTVDAAITAAGGTVAELAYLGVPTCAYAIVEDQRRVATALAADGTVHGGHWLDGLAVRALTADLEMFLADAGHRANLRSAALATIDGRGGTRVARELTS